jgi:1-acyl-sn-glycerol-3-phosphate acyltransferase
MKTLLSFLFWVFLAVTSVIGFVLAVVIFVVTTPFDRDRRINHWWACAWASLYAVAHPGWRVTTLHRDRIAHGQAYVLAANHTSVADIVLCFTLFRQFKWVSKRTNFFLPLIGWNMWLCRYIPLVRGDMASARQMVTRAKEFLERGISIMMFPEGTRSRDGALLPFKHGAFTMALESRVPVVPVAIHGGHALIPKHGKTFAPVAELVVEVLDPVPPDFADAASFAAAVRARIQDALDARAIAQAPVSDRGHAESEAASQSHA